MIDSDPSALISGTMCDICAEVKTEERFFHFNCGMHSYCLDCLTRHFRSVVDNGGSRESLKCPDAECQVTLREEDIGFFLDNVRMEKLNRFQDLAALYQNPNIRWCPNRECSEPVERIKRQKKMVCMRCRTEICYQCGEQWHGRSKCTEAEDKMFGSWVQGNRSDLRTCPRCNAHIIRNEGCNHVNCKFCKLEFCWLCRREYKPGHFDRTNLFGCPGGENATSKPTFFGSCCNIIRETCCWVVFPCRLCYWKCSDRQSRLGLKCCLPCFC